MEREAWDSWYWLWFGVSFLPGVVYFVWQLPSVVSDALQFHAYPHKVSREASAYSPLKAFVDDEIDVETYLRAKSELSRTVPARSFVR